MKISMTVGRRFIKDESALFHFYDGKFKTKDDCKPRTHKLKAASGITRPRKVKIKSILTPNNKLVFTMVADKRSVDFWIEGVKPGFHSHLVQGREKGKFSPWQVSITVEQ